jgi:predicted enzyme related to lactoylglutathione lyase
MGTMPERPSYEAGTPSWVDLGTPDVDASARFYGELLGWESVEAGPVEQTGGYRMFLKDGRRVAGLGPIMNEGQPPAWNTYISVDDAADAAERVASAGGQVLMGPMQVTDAGHMAVFVDGVGAVTGLWQPGSHRGAELVNEAGALAWNELACRDIERAKAFYHEVFGWDGATSTMEGGMVYTMWTLRGEMVGGMLEMGDEFPATVPPHWLAYFGVEDADAAAAQIGELGGSLIVEPTTIPAGRFTVASDPHGAAFAVIAIAAAS